MLTELSIENFAIIDRLSITFQKGLTVLTGETGAGKSIIIDALSLLTGGRGSVEYIRHGEKKAVLEGLFIIEEVDHPVYEKAEQLGIEIREDQMVVLHRTISQSGKSICRINGKLTTLGILKEIGQLLLDIHSQHETQALLDPEKHIELLDYYFQTTQPGFMNEYKTIYTKWKTLLKKYQSQNKNEKELAQRLDLLQFQLTEIQSANLIPNEDESLLEERNTLQNFEKIYQNITDAYNGLHGEQRALDWLSLTSNHLEIAGENNQDIKEIYDQFIDHYYIIEELSYKMRQQIDGMEFDPERLQIIESRLNEINQLKRKYGSNVEEILEYSAKVEEELNEIENNDQHIQMLEKRLEGMSQDLLLEAKNLHDLRLRAANQLEKAVLSELKELYLEKSQFKVDVNIINNGGSEHLNLDGVSVRATEKGIDHVQFSISTNPGEPPKPLHKIASGGEMSRIMLALKNIFAKHQGLTSVIFDEVDTGVSGRVAQAMAEKIYNISIGSQVLCISHLPQVASIADTHLKIEKKVKNDRTHTIVKELDLDGRIAEIGKMMTGTELTDASKLHAKELIEGNKQLKNK
ncbi:DNA repair protein RecN (Recombination protein N) [Gracilibacillus ureilyticus]|uniref:DNA repair protein RecN n=1 Tax=Gracilibacillus ureilyticus TaxID=531814 RepID=A0A1H9LWW7_9BACI|nr:DNA repair protein RecN [Gracilibacillus ureilyticus]SER15749.1 DNA repair protein RecN (Recombination protein N) [Gracilibacillus ureilyticus]